MAAYPAGVPSSSLITYLEKGVKYHGSKDLCGD